ncbi:hypothetical protein HDU77_011865, partial [Chytriomyces hyalinus]
MTSLLRSVFPRLSKHTRWRFYSTGPTTKSFTQAGANMHKKTRGEHNLPSKTLFCALTNKPELTTLDVNINSTAFVVGFIMEATHSRMSENLIHVNADGLTLDSVFKERESELAMSNAKKSNEFLGATGSGNDPQNATDDISTFRTSLWACMEKKGCIFKVIHPITKMCAHLDSALDDMNHVLILAPQQTELSQKSGILGVNLKCARKSAQLIKWTDEKPTISAPSYGTTKMTSLLRSVFPCLCQHTRWRFYSTGPTTKSFTQAGANMHKKTRVFCVVPYKSDFRPLKIDIDSTEIVFDLKKAIHAENMHAMAH